MILTSTLDVQSGACERVNSCEQVFLWSAGVKSDSREAERHFYTEIDLAFPTDTLVFTLGKPSLSYLDLQKGV